MNLMDMTAPNSPFTDHIGRPITVGDLVAVTRSGYAAPTMGTVAAFTPKSVRVQLAEDFRSSPQSASRNRAAGDTFVAHPGQMVVVQPLSAEA